MLLGDVAVQSAGVAYLWVGLLRFFIGPDLDPVDSDDRDIL